MKKYLIKTLAFFIFLTIALALQACIINSGDDGKIDGNEDNSVIKSGDFFSLENCNFNPTFTSDDSQERGFLIYDEIDFNSISFDSKKVKSSSVYYEVFYGGEKLKRLDPDFNNKYATFRLDNKGKYTVKVFGENTSGEKVEGSFDFGVNSGGRADHVEVVIKDSEGKIVNEVKGGGSYTFIAQAYSDDNAVEIISEDFFWDTPSKAGIKEKTFSIGNVTRREERNHDFYCYVRNNNNQKVNICKASFVIADNLVKTEAFPDGVYYDFGVEKVDNKLNLSVNTVLDGGNYFYDNITAEYRFDNGDTVPIEKSMLSSEGKFGVFISYDGINFSAYDKSDYDYSVDAQNRKKASYYSNGVKYQFDPTKASAKVYLGVWEKVYNTLGYNLSPTKVDSTLTNINLLSEAPASISISSIIGRSKNDTVPFASNYIDVNKEITDGSVEVNICCDMDGDGNIRDEFEGKRLFQTYQYFIPQIEITGGDLRDYTIDFSYQGMYSPIELISNQNLISGDLERYFVCPKEGVATMKVKSVFSDAESEITINVVNKIFESAKKLETINTDSVAVFYTLDMRPFMKVKEYRLSDYDNKSYNFRALREDEVLEYYVNGVLTEPNGFLFENNGLFGQGITVKIKGSNAQKTINNVYIMPSFAFYIDYQEYQISNLDERTFYGSNVSAENDSSIERYFYGLLPFFEYNLAAGQSILDITLSIQNDDGLYKTNYYDGSFTVKYKFSHYIDGVEYFFYAEILKIIVK
ncbi:hypothetical protein EOM82_03600 [bacterium]|nr:hypothetical protein [bacterium]